MAHGFLLFSFGKYIRCFRYIPLYPLFLFVYVCCDYNFLLYYIVIIVIVTVYLLCPYCISGLYKRVAPVLPLFLVPVVPWSAARGALRSVARGTRVAGSGRGGAPRPRSKPGVRLEPGIDKQGASSPRGRFAGLYLVLAEHRAPLQTRLCLGGGVSSGRCFFPRAVAFAVCTPV